jgi:hypothetical protein
VIRLVETSVGRVVLGFWDSGQVEVSVLDDRGWDDRNGEWGDGEIAKALFYVAGHPLGVAAAGGPACFTAFRPESP